MMKLFLIFFWAAVSSPVRAAQPDGCPKLAGDFSCVFENGEFSPLKIIQWTKPGQDGITYYSFDYTSTPGEPDVSKASIHGERDDFGWVTKCKDNRLVSVSSDDSMLQEIYLDTDQAITFTLNYKITLVCPGKSAQNTRPRVIGSGTKKRLHPSH